jgi:signal transduction histidine kinase/CheY-like chemotaxis protein
MGAAEGRSVLGADSGLPSQFQLSRWMVEQHLTIEGESTEQAMAAAKSDARTQAEVGRILFANAMPSAVVTYLGMAIVVAVYWGRLPTGPLLALTGLCMAIQTALVVQWLNYSRQIEARDGAGDFGWSVGQLAIYGYLSFALMGGVTLLALLLTRASIPAAPMVATVMLLIYLIGATVADFMYRPAVLGYPIIALLPLGLLHASSGEPVQWAMAAFFGFYFFAVVLYSGNFSDRLQLSIYQRYRIDTLMRKLDAQRRDVQAAHDAKSRFFAAASHDVRQPLQAIGLLTDALKLPAAQPEREELLRQIDANAQALRGLFDQVLEASRLQAGSIQPQMAAVALQPLFDRITARFASDALRKGVRLSVRASDAAVTADVRLLERMVANLVGNAIKHTPSGGCVWVGWRAQRRCIEVRDSGVGIAPQEQIKIFDEFYQITDANADPLKPSPGLGLGLAIVQRFAVLCGHRVGVRSAVGLGSVFWIGLVPAALTSRHARKPANTAAQAASPAAQQKGTLVYVENDPTLLAVTARLLQFGGWQVHAFASADLALKKLQESTDVHALLTDYRLVDNPETAKPGSLVDGAQLVQAARRIAQHAHLRALVLTGDAAVRELQGLSGVRVLHKPIKSIELMAALDELG